MQSCVCFGFITRFIVNCGYNLNFSVFVFFEFWQVFYIFPAGTRDFYSAAASYLFNYRREVHQARNDKPYRTKCRKKNAYKVFFYKTSDFSKDFFTNRPENRQVKFNRISPVDNRCCNFVPLTLKKFRHK